MTQQIRTALPIGATCIVASIYWRRNNLLSFFLLSLCLHSLSYLCLPISRPISISLAISISFAICISLPISISIPISISSLSLSPISLHYTEKHKTFITGANNLLRFAYSWGHRLKIAVYLAETEIH
jgi:hypothetical protein